MEANICEHQIPLLMYTRLSFLMLIDYCVHRFFLYSKLTTILNTNNRSYNHQERCMFWLAWIQYYEKNTSGEICGERITKGVHQSLSRHSLNRVFQLRR